MTLIYLLPQFASFRVHEVREREEGDGVAKVKSPSTFGEEMGRNGGKNLHQSPLTQKWGIPFNVLIQIRITEDF